MNSKKVWITLMLLAVVSFTFLPRSFAGKKLAFENGITQQINADCTFKQCASIKIVPPSNGYVVVTAAGLASFSNDVSFLELTLSTKPSAKGPWMYRLTPGFQLFQNYSVRYVFPVTGDGVTSRTFYLNGRLCRGPEGDVSVETGTITAEFYSSSDVQVQAQLQAQSSEPRASNLQVNTP